jgi:hypothetical protein
VEPVQNHPTPLLRKESLFSNPTIHYYMQQNSEVP